MEQIYSISSGTFTKLQEVTVSFVMSVHVEQFGSHWTNFREIWYLIFENLSSKFQFL